MNVQEYEERLEDKINELVVELIGRCQEARFYAGSEKQRALVDALQKFLEI